MGELALNPKSIAAMRGIIAPRETVLWADRQRGPGKRETKFIIVSMCLLAAIFIPLVIFAPASFYVVGPLWGPGLVWATLRLRFRHFAITDRRVIYASSVWPRIVGDWKLHLLNSHRIRHAEGRDIIHLTQSAFFSEMEPRGFWSQWYWRFIPTYIENIPHIETVRQLLLRQIATAKPPEPTPKRHSPAIHGTMTG